VKLRFTDYGGANDDSLLVPGWTAHGGWKDYVQSEVMPMTDGCQNDEDGFWTVESERFGLIMFQSIDIEVDA